MEWLKIPAILFPFPINNHKSLRPSICVGPEHTMSFYVLLVLVFSKLPRIA